MEDGVGWSGKGHIGAVGTGPTIRAHRWVNNRRRKKLAKPKALVTLLELLSYLTKGVRSTPSSDTGTYPYFLSTFFSTFL